MKYRIIRAPFKEVRYDLENKVALLFVTCDDDIQPAMKSAQMYEPLDSICK